MNMHYPPIMQIHQSQGMLERGGNAPDDLLQNLCLRVSFSGILSSHVGKSPKNNIFRNYKHKTFFHGDGVFISWPVYLFFLLASWQQVVGGEVCLGCMNLPPYTVACLLQKLATCHCTQKSKRPYHILKLVDGEAAFLLLMKCLRNPPLYRVRMMFFFVFFFNLIERERERVVRKGCTNFSVP